MSAPAPRDRRSGGWAAGWAAARPATRPALRIGDADRGEAVDALGDHFATGRLTHEEYDDRASRALRARTAAELAPLFVDLPAPHPPVLTGAPRPQSLPPRGPQPLPPRRSVSRLAGGRVVARTPRVPLLPTFLVLVGLAVLLDEAAVLLLGTALLWWLTSVRWRRAKAEWAARRHGWVVGPHRRC